MASEGFRVDADTMAFVEEIRVFLWTKMRCEASTTGLACNVGEVEEKWS